jgi:hypothetical protein
LGVAAAGAAAVLAGLVFVAVSINLERVLEVRGLPGRAGESIMMFVGAMLASLLLLVPGQSHRALGLELAVTGAVLATGLMLIVWPGLKHQAHHPLSWRITRILAALAASVPIAIARRQRARGVGRVALLALRRSGARPAGRNRQRLSAAGRSRTG